MSHRPASPDTARNAMAAAEQHRGQQCMGQLGGEQGELVMPSGGGKTLATPCAMLRVIGALRYINQARGPQPTGGCSEVALT